MKHALMLSAAMLMLLGCAPPDEATATGTTPSPPTQTADMNNAFRGYHWLLQDATNASGQRIDALLLRPEMPIQIDFLDDRIAVRHLCNDISGPVRVTGQTLSVGALVSTRMACVDSAVMALDAEMSKRLQSEVRYELRESDPPQLQWTTVDGDVLSFIGAPTPETRFGNPGEIVYLEVAAASRPCPRPDAPTPQHCLEVRDRQYDEEGRPLGVPGEWRLFDGDIEGYVHEEGIRQILRVKRFAIANAAVDAPSEAYVLDLSIESESVAR